MAEATQPALQPDKLTQWPGAFGAYKYSRAAMVKIVWSYLAIVVGYYILQSIISTLFGSSLTQTNPNGTVVTLHIINPIGQLLIAALALYLGVLTTSLTLGAVKGKTYTSAIFKTSLGYYLRFVGLSILVSLAVTGLFILLVVPAFIFGPRLILAPYFLIDQNLGVVESFKASWHQSKGNVGKLYGIIGAEIIMAILCLVLIGIYFLLMFAAVNAVLYYYIKSTQGTKTVAAAA